jgi:hypothetical protein
MSAFQAGRRPFATDRDLGSLVTIFQAHPFPAERTGPHLDRGIARQEIRLHAKRDTQRRGAMRSRPLANRAEANGPIKPLGAMMPPAKPKGMMLVSPPGVRGLPHAS